MEFAEVTVKESPGLCRCCLSEGCYKDLGTEYSWMNDTEVYADMLLDCFDIGISQHNDGPNGPKRLICEVCITRLRDACNFKKQVVDSEKKFIDMLGRGDFRLTEKNTVLLPIYSCEAPMKAEAIEEVTVRDYDHSNVDFLDDNDFTEDEELVKSERASISAPVASTSSAAVKRGRPKKKESEVPEKKPKMKAKSKIPKDMALKNEQQLAALLITIIQHSTMLPFRWHKGRFMCFYCSSTFNTSSALKDHDRDGHVEINITDIVTRVMYDDRRIKLDVATARCSQCDQQITDISDYIEHLYEKHDTDFDSDITKLFVSFRLSDDEMCCVECGLHFQYFGQLLIHTNKTHMNKHVCEICGQGVVGKVNIYNHMKQMHAIKACKYCDETFNTQYALFQHVSTMHKTDGLKCSVCGEFQQNRYKMKRHMALVHDCKNLQIVCEYCSKVFTRNNKYVQHKERVHFKQKNITCDVCGYGAYDVGALKLHMVCHEEVMPYSCACGKRFRRSKNLIAHKILCPELNNATKNLVTSQNAERNLDRVVKESQTVKMI